MPLGSFPTLISATFLLESFPTSITETVSVSGFDTQTNLSSGVIAMGPELVGPIGVACADTASLRSSLYQQNKMPHTKSDDRKSFVYLNFTFLTSSKWPGATPPGHSLSDWGICANIFDTA